MKSGKLGVGIIGTGGVANFAHIPNYIRNPRTEVIAIADVDLERAQQSAERHGIGAYYQDYHEMLARDDIDLVSVTTPVFAHAEAAIAAMEAGKHVLCEKPMARTLAEADAMVETAQRTGVLLTMGYQSRFSRLWERTKQLLDEGMIGDVYSLNIVSTGKAGLPATWFLDPEKAGGGILMDWGIYTAYMLNWLMGPVEKVYAITRRFRTEYPVRGVMVHDVKVEDAGAITLEFKNGAIGNWFLTWAGQTTHGYTAIDGSLGSILMQPGRAQGPLVYTTKQNDPEYLQGWRHLAFNEFVLADLHYRKIEHLVAAILDDAPLVMTGADGRDAVELVQAIYQSARDGVPVTLPLQRGTTTK